MDRDHEHAQDIFIQADGSEEHRHPWVVASDEQLNGKHSGGVCVHADATFEIGMRGHLAGSLSLRPGGKARIAGRHSGSLHVGPGAVAEVTGEQSGSVHVDRGGLLQVQAGGKLAGSLHVAGMIENRGTRGGSVYMSGGQILDLDGGVEKQPTKGQDGTLYYTW